MCTCTCHVHARTDAITCTWIRTWSYVVCVQSVLRVVSENVRSGGFLEGSPEESQKENVRVDLPVSQISPVLICPSCYGCQARDPECKAYMYVHMDMYMLYIYIYIHIYTSIYIYMYVYAYIIYTYICSKMPCVCFEQPRTLETRCGYGYDQECESDLPSVAQGQLRARRTPRKARCFSRRSD